ncbi:two component transcriptional regulator winged helix family [Clostridium sp. CAG:567]|nr:two component transcriptional regulator winged helix family [Clostridium sp. CAG:567]
MENKRENFNEEVCLEENSAKANNAEMAKKTILVVDDEKPIVDILTYNLQKEGYSTLEANDGEEAIKIATEKKPDLILLDIMLPKVDGLTVCKKLRHTLNVPILILSAKDEEIDKILGLELGADDYITKPFSVRELMARVKANLRKAEIQVQSTDAIEEPKKESILIEVGELSINIEKFEVKVRGKVIDLTLREFEVLKYLANQPGQVVTRETLLEKVWGYEYYGDIRTVDVTVRRIREKIEKDTSAPKILITKRGVGYYLATN